MSLATSGARGSFVTVLAQVLAFFARFFSIVILARILAPDIFGLVAIVSALTFFTTSIVALGIPAATSQATSLSNRAASALFLINSSLGMIAAAALFFASSFISEFYDEPTLEPIVRWLALVPLITGITAQFRQQLIRRLSFTPTAISEVVGQVVGVAAAIIMATQGATWEAITTQVIALPFMRLIIIASAAKWIPGRPGGWREEVIPIMRIGVNVFGMNILRNTSKQIITPALGIVSSPGAVGQFDRAQQLTLTPTSMLVDQLQQVVVPVLSRLRNDPARMLRYIQRFQLVSSYILASAFLLLAAMADPIIAILLGPGWELTATVLQFVAIGAVFRSSGQSMQWVFIAARATRMGLRFNMWSQPALTAVSLAGLPWGVIGVAIAGALAWALYWPLCAMAAARAGGFFTLDLIPAAARGPAFFALPVAITSGAVASFVNDPWIAVTAGIGAGGVCGVIIYLLIPQVRRDMTAIRDALRVALNREK